VSIGALNALVVTRLSQYRLHIWTPPASGANPAWPVNIFPTSSRAATKLGLLLARNWPIWPQLGRSSSAARQQLAGGLPAAEKEKEREK